MVWDGQTGRQVRRQAVHADIQTMRREKRNGVDAENNIKERCRFRIYFLLLDIVLRLSEAGRTGRVLAPEPKHSAKETPQLALLLNGSGNVLGLCY